MTKNKRRDILIALLRQGNVELSPSEYLFMLGYPCCDNDAANKLESSIKKLLADSASKGIIIEGVEF